jgi:hypothetical protein
VTVEERLKACQVENAELRLTIRLLQQKIERMVAVNESWPQPPSEPERIPPDSW